MHDFSLRLSSASNTRGRGHMEPRFDKALRSVIMVAPLEGDCEATLEKKDIWDINCTDCTMEWMFETKKSSAT